MISAVMRHGPSDIGSLLLYAGAMTTVERSMSQWPMIRPVSSGRRTFLLPVPRRGTGGRSGTLLYRGEVLHRTGCWTTFHMEVQ